MTNYNSEYVETLELQRGGASFEWDKYGGVTLNYTERQTDYWSSDTETSIDIDKEEAQKIVDFLRSKYDLT